MLPFPTRVGVVEELPEMHNVLGLCFSAYVGTFTPKREASPSIFETTDDGTV